MPKDTHSVLIADALDADRFLLKRAIASHAERLRVVGEVENGEQLRQYLSGRDQYADRERHPFPDVLVIELLFPPTGAMQVLVWLRTQDLMNRLKVAVITDPLFEVSIPLALEQSVIGFYPRSPFYDGITQLAQSLQRDLLRVAKPGASEGTGETPKL